MRLVVNHGRADCTLRTPMIGVTGMLKVLAQSDLTRQQRQMVATAQGSAAALLQIIGDTLDFSKIEAGKLEIGSTTFAVRGVVDAAVATFIHTASAKGLRLEAHCDERLAPAHVGDPLRIRQILSNLLSNAVKFTEVGYNHIFGGGKIAGTGHRVASAPDVIACRAHSLSETRQTLDVAASIRGTRLPVQARPPVAWPERDPGGDANGSSTTEPATGGRS